MPSLTGPSEVDIIKILGLSLIRAANWNYRREKNGTFFLMQINSHDLMSPRGKKGLLSS